MAGNLPIGPAAASSSLTVTNLHSLAADQSWLSGWTSASFNNTSNKYWDWQIGVNLVTHASNRQAGFINIYIVPALNDTPTWPATASGTIGTEGALSFTDSEERDSLCELVASIQVDNSASSIVCKLIGGIAARFGGALPAYFAIFISHNASTTTTAGLAASGSTVSATPIIGSYT